jgi:hypothetical protein
MPAGAAPSRAANVVSLALPERIYPMVNENEWGHRNFPDVADCRPIPAVNYLEQASFVFQHCQCKPMWGMPVEMVIGCKITPEDIFFDQTRAQNIMN